MTGNRGILSIKDQARLAEIESLPHSLRDFAETHGIRIALRLIAEYGGVKLTVPVKPAAHLEITRRLGEADADIVISFFRGQKIDVPRSALNARSKARRILELAAKRRRQVDIAREVGVSDRWVREVISKNDEKDPRQKDMFD